MYCRLAPCPSLLTTIIPNTYRRHTDRLFRPCSDHIPMDHLVHNYSNPPPPPPPTHTHTHSPQSADPLWKLQKHSHELVEWSGCVLCEVNQRGKTLKFFSINPYSRNMSDKPLKLADHGSASSLLEWEEICWEERYCESQSNMRVTSIFLQLAVLSLLPPTISYSMNEGKHQVSSDLQILKCQETGGKANILDLVHLARSELGAAWGTDNNLGWQCAPQCHLVWKTLLTFKCDASQAWSQNFAHATIMTHLFSLLLSVTSSLLEDWPNCDLPTSYVFLLFVLQRPCSRW